LLKVTPPGTHKASNSGLLAYFDRPAFSIGGVEFLSIDVALAAMARGDWSRFERQLAEGLACDAYATATGKHPAADAIEAAGNAFRYDRELIAAAEVNAWLDGWGLSIEEWTGYLTRSLLRDALRDSIDDALERHEPSTARLIEAAPAEGSCSGLFDTFEDSFAGRAALVYDEAPEGPADSNVSTNAAAALVRANAHWLSTRPPEDTLARAQRVLAIEAAHDARVAVLLAEAPLSAIVDRHRLEWQRITTDTAMFSTEHAANEAVLCMTHERLSLQDVASLARRTVERQERFANALDPSDPLLSAEVGSILGPLAVGDRFEITRIASRTWPSPDDPRIAERARRAVVAAAVQLAVRERVTGRRSR
jgi:hypothetical protein